MTKGKIKKRKECPGGDQSCRECGTGANIISPEAIARGPAEKEIKVVCCSDEGGGPDCCGCGEG